MKLFFAFLLLAGCSAITSTDDPAPRVTPSGEPPGDLEPPRELPNQDAGMSVRDASRDATPRRDGAPPVRSDAGRDGATDVDASPDCGDCDDGDECTADACVDGVCTHAAIECELVGESCAAPYVLELVEDRIRMTGTFGDLADDHQTICLNDEGALTTGGDAVFFLPLSEPSDVVIHTIGRDADTAIAVATTCSNDGFYLGCNQSISSESTASRIFVHRFDPAREGPGLYILVDAADPEEEGDFLLSVWIDPVVEDSCDSPYDISGGGSLVGYVGRGGGSELGSCQDRSESGESEAVVSFLASPDGEAQFRAFSNDFTPDLYVRRVCEGILPGVVDLACEEGAGEGSVYAEHAELSARTPLAGTHYLFVDGSSPAAAGAHYLLLYEP